MRKMSGSIRAGAALHRAGAPRRPGAPQYATGTERYATVRRVGGAGGLILLSVLFWLIFYQNLPNNLHGMADNGPVSVANQTDRIIKIAMILLSVLLRCVPVAGRARARQEFQCRGSRVPRACAAERRMVHRPLSHAAAVRLAHNHIHGL